MSSHPTLIDPVDSSGRNCTKCQQWFNWSQFHKKGSRRASRCNNCVNMEKRRKRKRVKTQVFKGQLVSQIVIPLPRRFTEFIEALKKDTQ